MPEKNNNFRACVEVVGGFGVIRHIDQLIKPLLPLLNVFVQATFLTKYEESHLFLCTGEINFYILYI